MQCGRDQPDRRADKIEVDFLDLFLRWRRRHELGRDPTDQRHQKDGDYRNLDAVSIAVDDDAAQNRSRKYRDIGARFHKTGPGKYFIPLQMLWKHRIFDRPEKGGLQAEQEQRGQHDRNIVQPQPDPADHGDEYLQRFDEARDPGLVVIVRQLSGERRKQEKRQDEQSGREGVKGEILGFAVINAVCNQDDHREFEEIVVKCPQ